MRGRRDRLTFRPVNMTLTLWLAAAFAAIAAFSGWRGARPPEPPRVRMAPWRFLMVLSAAIVSLLLIHVVTLLGAPAA